MSWSPITGKVSETGEHPRLADYIKELKYFCLSRKGKVVELVSPEVLSENRSDAQGRYYWALLGLLSDATGYHKDDWHNTLREMFFFEIVVIGNAEVKRLLSTQKNKTTTAKMAEYTEKIREWQQENLPEAYLPTADEWKKWEEGEMFKNKETETR